MTSWSSMTLRPSVLTWWTIRTRIRSRSLSESSSTASLGTCGSGRRATAKKWTSSTNFSLTVSSCSMPINTHRSGFGKGRRSGLGNGLRSGLGNGHRSGFGDGHRSGFGDGHRSGFGNGHRSGFGNGHRSGFRNGHRAGFIMSCEIDFSS